MARIAACCRCHNKTRMTDMLTFIAGLMLGGFLGVVLMAVMAIAKEQARD